MTTADQTIETIKSIRSQLDELESAVFQAKDVQWDRSPSSNGSPAERRGRGGHTDPTGDAAVDSKRLSVRRSLSEASHEMVRVERAVRAAKGRVTHAMGRWEGE